MLELVDKKKKSWVISLKYQVSWSIQTCQRGTISLQNVWISDQNVVVDMLKHVYDRIMLELFLRKKFHEVIKQDQWGTIRANEILYQS